MCSGMRRQIMPRRIANNPRDPLGRPVSIDAGPDYRWRGRLQTDAGMIVIKDEDSGILRIDSAANARVARTEITIFDVRWSRAVLMLHRLTTPGTILPMGGDNHPLFAQRMPAFFPNHKFVGTACGSGRLILVIEGQLISEINRPLPQAVLTLCRRNDPRRLHLTGACRRGQTRASKQFAGDCGAR